MMEILPLPHSEPGRASRKRMAFRRASAFATLCLCIATGVVRAATLTATLDRDNIILGQSATLSLNFSGGSPDNVPAIPAIPAIPNLRIDHIGQSSQTIGN